VKLFVYMFSGFCAAIVGLIISSELMAAHPATGTTFELNAIAAAVLGGTSMSGGRGTIGGTIIGAFVIGILSDGLVMMGVSEFWQMVIKGVVIIAAVVVDQAQRKLQQRVAPQQWPNWRNPAFAISGSSFECHKRRSEAREAGGRRAHRPTACGVLRAAPTQVQSLCPRRRLIDRNLLPLRLPSRARGNPLAEAILAVRPSPGDPATPVAFRDRDTVPLP
jgi:hypothetical protein